MKISSIWKRALSVLMPPTVSSSGGSQSPLIDQADDAIAADVERTLAMDFSDPQVREAQRDEVYALMTELDARIEVIRQQAKGYPRNPVSAEVRFADYRMIGLAESLTQHFKATGWLGHEGNASGLWAKATLAVCSHYHHMVGPAMLANADCCERLGEPAEALARYRAVMNDFSFLLDEFEDCDAIREQSDRIAIESLKTAAARVLTLDAGSNDVASVASLISRAESLLARPVPAD